MIGFDDIDYASQTDVGVRRSHNQDSHALLPAKDLDQWRQRGHVFVVADGMGAHAVGELASKLAADSIPHIYSKHAQEGPVAALRKAFVEANITIHTRGQQNREFAGMGTTATALLVRPEGAWIGHVGDSRAYRIRNGVIEQLSFDHSLVWELARRQRKDPDELTGVPSNVIVRSLGPEPLVQVDVEGPHVLRPGDLFVLCSDGLSGPVSDREIGAVVSVLPPTEACSFLVHLANLQGGPDNITCVVVRVAGSGDSVDEPDTDTETHPAFRQRVRSFLDRIYWPYLTLALGILFAILAIYLHQRALPGSLSAFLLGAISLSAGLVGLIVQMARDKREEASFIGKPGKPKAYRKVPCAIDETFVSRLEGASSTLEQQIRDRNWQVDWQAAQSHLQTAKQALAEGRLADAFAARCRAMLIFMDAIHSQRVREEVFKPLWDQVAKKNASSPTPAAKGPETAGGAK